MTESTDKRKLTYLKRYGNEIYQKTDDFIQKRKKTCLEKYGYETPLSCPEIRKKIYKSLDEEKRRNSVKKSRELEKQYDDDFYSKKETIELCKNINEEYFGSGGYRKLIKEDKKLYFSIFHYSEEMKNVKYGNSFTPRVKFLLNEFKRIQCPYCGNYLKYDVGLKKIMYICHNCKLPKIRSEEYCYLNDLNYEEEKKKISGIIKNAHKNYKGPNVNSKECFIKKYGKEEGIKRYLSHIRNVVDSNHRYSNISKKFFEELIEKTNLDKSLCFYAENEKRFDLTEEEQKTLKRKCIYVDFLVGNKIIEYNGLYWHRKDDKRIQDFNRKIFFERLGYEVLTVWDKTEGELERAINFINSGRYKILTSEGYSDFDGISKKTVNKILRITLKNNQEIEVSENHNFIIQNVAVKANTLKIGDCLEIKNNILERITNIEIIEKEEEVYDVLETKNHSYYANGILNHNCQFLGSSYTLVDSEVLKGLKSSECEAVYDDKLSVYVEPEENHKYIMGVDPAKHGLDYYSVNIIDVTSFPFVQVATARILKANYQVMPEFIYEWGCRFNNAFVIVENNEGAGTYAVNILKSQYDYENLYISKNDVGFRTTVKTRIQILETFKNFLENKRLIIKDKTTISELFTFIIKDKKYQADDGCHDDMIMSLCLCFVPFIDVKNFDDNLIELIKKLYSNDDMSDESITDYLCIGEFDSIDDGYEDSLAGKKYDDEYEYSTDYYSMF